MRKSRLSIGLIFLGLLLMAVNICVVQASQDKERSVYAQPSQLDPEDTPDEVQDADDNDPAIVIDEIPEEFPDDEVEFIDQEKERHLWFKSLPVGMDWVIGFGVLLSLWIMVYFLYKIMLTGHVRKLKHPANLRAIMILIAGLMFILWNYFWFVMHLDVFGLLIGGIFALIGVVILTTALIIRK
jgi:hypothetical protein